MARILLGVSASIAAYKAVELLRLAIKAGHSVRVIQSDASINFVGKSSFEAISGVPVLVDEFERDPFQGRYPGEIVAAHNPISHLGLVDSADAYVIAPASANTIAKLSNGIADNLLCSSFLACTAPVFIAPAMNNKMWQNAATQENVERLRKRGVHIVDPDVGSLASRGEYGIGRLADPAEILKIVEAVAFSGVPRSMDGLKVLISAGGTREPIDSVRYIGNRSSGKMGYAIAEEAMRRGAEVTVVAANVNLPKAPGIHYIEVETAQQMYEGMKDLFIQTMLLIMVAAVADFRPKLRQDQKIDKSKGIPKVELEQTVDIVSELASSKSQSQIVIGFAAENGASALDRAREKLDRKGLNAIIVNDISRKDIGFEVDKNEVTFVFNGGEERLSKAGKNDIAAEILNRIEKMQEYTGVIDSKRQEQHSKN